MKKILMIATCNFLTNRSDGGRQCSYRNYSVLCQIFGKENVYICMISNDEIAESEHISRFPTYKNRIQQIWWILGLRVGYSLKTKRQIIQKINQERFDYIWFDRSTLGYFCKRVRTKAEKIVFFHNVERQYIKNKILHENIGYLVSCPAFLFNEQIAIKKADKIICLNNRDSELIDKLYGRKADSLLPISFEDAFNEKKVQYNEIYCDEEKSLLFVGSYFQPNIEGIEWFINNVMSQLLDVKLIIVGKGLEKKTEEWENKNVQVVGTVQDVEGYYIRAGAVVLPIFYGDGMKVKTAEALMYGKVVFATKEALEGYEAEGQSDIFECNTKEEFTNSIRKFYEEKREGSVSLSNRQLFLDKYENRAMVRRMVELFRLGND